jgi:hypothetical protein
MHFADAATAYPFSSKSSFNDFDPKNMENANRLFCRQQMADRNHSLQGPQEWS